MSDLLNCIRTNNEIKEYINFFGVTDVDNSAQRLIVAETISRHLLPPDSNIESFLSIIEGIEMYIWDEEVNKTVVLFQTKIKQLILERIIKSEDGTVSSIYKNFYTGLRSLKEQSSRQDQNFNVFTTNYDMMNEKTMEDIGTHYYAGFTGIINRRFNIANYNCKYVNSYNVKNTHFVLNDNHINLYKLHGSISWVCVNGELYEKNPYDIKGYSPEIIYPSVAKFSNTNLITYYSALMREFSNKICQKDSTLVVSGTSLNDEHINKLIENALLINSFTMIIFPCGDKSVIDQLKEKYKNNQNVIVYDKSITFEQLADILLSLSGEVNG